MLKKLIVAFAAIATLTFGQVSTASAFSLGSMSRDSDISRHRSVGKTMPLGFAVFCMMNPKECKNTGGRSVVAHTPKLQAILASVNRSVNNSIRPRHDRGDVWTVNAKAGDCEDYALTKRSRLIKAGIPAGALRLAVVKTRKGEGHAVLFVKTTAGEFVLDNLKKTIVKRQAMPYRLVSVSSSNPMRWKNS